MAVSGRKVRIKYDSGAGAAVIAGARTDNFAINRTPIEVTDKDDSGVRTYLNEIGTFSIDADLEGVLINDTLMDLASDPTTGVAEDFELDVQGIGTFAGVFFISAFTVAGADGDNPATFTCNIQSAGAITYTAAV